MATLSVTDHNAHEVLPWLRGLLGDRLVAVALFGSRARGDHRPESDWDLLIIAEGLPEGYMERYRFFRCPGRPLLGTNISVMAKTPEEFEGYLPAIYLDIALDAQVLYDPKGYAAERLSKLRRIIDKAGLYRERIGSGGFMWRWRDPPPFGKWSIEWDFLDRAG